MTTETPTAAPAAVPFATRSAFLAAAKASPRRYTEATLPVLGTRVRIQSLTEGEKSRYESATLKRGKDARIDFDKLRDARLRLILLVLVDEAGATLFTPTDLDALRDLDSADTSAIYNVAYPFCGFEKGDVEELAGN